MKCFYLAHPALSKDYVREWELFIEQKFGINLINPFFEGQPFEKAVLEKLYTTGKVPKLNYDQASTIVENDIQFIKDCDGTVAIIDGSISYGTIMEIIYSRLNNKPVYIICTNGYETHAWLHYHSTKIFISFKEFEEWLEGKRKEDYGTGIYNQG